MRTLSSLALGALLAFGAPVWCESDSTMTADMTMSDGSKMTSGMVMTSSSSSTSASNTNSADVTSTIGSSNATTTAASATTTETGAIATGTSVPVADFEACFNSSSIVPDVIPEFKPAVQFYVGYTTEKGTKTLLTPGQNLTTNEAHVPFECSVENIQNVPNITNSTRFLLYLVGPDIPSRSNHSSGNLRHWLAGNLTLSSDNSTLLSTAQLLTNSSEATNEYSTPCPSNNTGVHRYVYQLFVQPEGLNSGSIESYGLNTTTRSNFNLTEFSTSLGLNASIGGTAFFINTDLNSTSTSNLTTTSAKPPVTSSTSSSNSSSAAGATMRVGGTSWAASVAVTVFMASVGVFLFGIL